MILANENAIESGGYVINNSLRFQSASSTYMGRTPATATNRTTWTLSAWVKRGSLSSQQKMFTAGTDISGLNQFSIQFDSADTLIIFSSTSAVDITLTTSQVFRDPSAWYHIVIVFDTTNATVANRVKLYVNGSQVTAFGTATYPAQNNQPLWNSAISSGIARYMGSAGQAYFDGYMTEINFIDGQALTPSSFGQTNSLTGQWIASKYTGTYGTNGFYLPFSNGTSTTTLGADSSGNANNWTLTNFTRSAGVSDCFMFDVPSGNGSGSGTQPSSNYCVGNPNATYLGYTTFTNANLQVNFTNAGNVSFGFGTIGISSGKWYWEGQISVTGSDATRPEFGIISSLFPYSSATGSIDIGGSAYGWTYRKSGTKMNNGTATAYGSSYTTGDIIGVALDMDAGTIVFYKNNVSQGTAFTGLTGIIFPAYGGYGAGGTTSIINNYGNRSFAYTPPTGFKALCTANLPTATIKQGNKYMDATTYTGTGNTTQTITNAGAFQPDFVWVKSRSGAFSHHLTDAVRGVSKDLSSNTTSAENNYSPYGTSAFNSNGFAVTDNATGDYGCNGSGSTFVGWQWQAGQGSTSSNTNGSITSTTSVNATAGFSIVTWTGNGTTGATIGHGLGIAPKMIIAKTRGIVQNWVVYRPEIGNSNVLLLNSSSAAFADGAWNSTTPTSSVFTVNNGQGVNQASATYVAYCFAEIAGFSKFGSYTGNGSADGTFVYTGFRPKFVMIKSSTAVDDWRMYDASRPGYNVIGGTLLADTAGAETTAAEIDFTSNGFKLRITTTPNAAQTYIYAAFASNPFAQSNAV